MLNNNYDNNLIRPRAVGIGQLSKAEHAIPDIQLLFCVAIIQ